MVECKRPATEKATPAPPARRSRPRPSTSADAARQGRVRRTGDPLSFRDIRPAGGPAPSEELLVHLGGGGEAHRLAELLGTGRAAQPHDPDAGPLRPALAGGEQGGGDAAAAVVRGDEERIDPEPAAG